MKKIKKLIDEIDESVRNPSRSELHQSYKVLCSSILKQIRLLIKLDLYLYSGCRKIRKEQLKIAEGIVDNCLYRK